LFPRKAETRLCFWNIFSMGNIYPKVGKGGIRTHGGRKATPIFKIGAINHSATFPKNY